MKLRPIILTLFLSTLSSPSLYATPNNWGGINCPTSGELQKVLIDTLQDLQPIVGVSVAITSPHCGNFIYTAGVADINKHTLMSEETQLPIASNTKPILAALALMLMEKNTHLFPQGINTKLTDILDNNGRPFFSADGHFTLANGKKINLAESEFYKEKTGKPFNCATDSEYRCPQLDKIDMHHLLMESSGLADLINENDLLHTQIPDVYQTLLFQLFSPTNTPSNAMLSDIDALKKFGIVQKAEADPIKPAQSHNTDALLLAVILERCSGLSLNELLEQKILKPLRLSADTMYFHTASSSTLSPVRQYVFLNTDDEVENAIATGTTFSILSPVLAHKLTPTFLHAMGRHVISIPYIKNGVLLTRPALDILELNPQGFVGFPGPGGIYAQPKAYVHFYQALSNGDLLSPYSQQLFNQSFMDMTSPDDYKFRMGYASNSFLEWEYPQKMKLLIHQGLVPGGESIVMFNYETHMTIMINTNFSGYVKRLNMPCLQVTTTPYFDYEVMAGLEMRIAKLMVS